jgi:outer membrane protein
MVRQAIDDVRTTDGYAMIFAAGTNSAMLSADKSLDVTDKVLARMRTIAANRPAATARPTTGQTGRAGRGARGRGPSPGRPAATEPVAGSRRVRPGARGERRWGAIPHRR